MLVYENLSSLILKLIYKFKIRRHERHDQLKNFIEKFSRQTFLVCKKVT